MLRRLWNRQLSRMHRWLPMGSASTGRSDRSQRTRSRPVLETLENRLAPAIFTAGDVFAADRDSAAPREFMNVTAGGDLSGAAVLANLPDRSLGQIAWSANLTTAYVT